MGHTLFINLCKSCSNWLSIYRIDANTSSISTCLINASFHALMYQVQCPRASLIEDSTHATAVEVDRNEKELH